MCSCIECIGDQPEPTDVEMRQFLTQEFGQPTPREIYLYNLAKEYDERTEAYDRLVCTGPIKDGYILPANNQERHLVMRNARRTMQELADRAKINHNISLQEVGRAIQQYDRRPEGRS